MAKLSITQRAVLQAAFDTHNCQIDFFDAAKAGGNGSTLGSLEKRGLLYSRTYANGRFWELTPAGRSAITQGE